MLPVLIGIAIASAFVALTGWVYGFGQFQDGLWPLLVIWGLIVGPAMMFVSQGEGRDERRRRRSG
jgi:hypothetical protein